MNITIQVDEISLSTAVADVIGYDKDDGAPHKAGERTVGDVVAEKIVDRIIETGDDHWQMLRERVRDIRAEMIREAVRPSIEEAISAPLRKTDGFGEPMGGPTTLKQIIVDEARKMLSKPASTDYRSSQTVVQKIVAEEVKQAFVAEIKDAVKQAREQVAGEIGQQVASAVSAAMKGR